MKAHTTLRVSIAVTIFAAAQSAIAEAPATSVLTVNVASFRNTQGALGCRLYSASEGFPESSQGTVERRIVIRGATARCEFVGISPGTYAVSVMHDENDNQRLDKNFLGIPTEGYGVSNNQTHAMSSPTWRESKFVVEAGKNIGLSVALRY